jgi:hypothetical protein
MKKKKAHIFEFCCRLFFLLSIHSFVRSVHDSPSILNVLSATLRRDEPLGRIYETCLNSHFHLLNRNFLSKAPLSLVVVVVVVYGCKKVFRTCLLGPKTRFSFNRATKLIFIFLKKERNPIFLRRSLSSRY